MAITRLNVDGKPLAFKEEVTTHVENANIHVTTNDRSLWNNKQEHLEYYTEDADGTANIYTPDGIRLCSSTRFDLLRWTRWNTFSN